MGNYFTKFVENMESESETESLAEQTPPEVSVSLFNSMYVPIILLL